MAEANPIDEAKIRFSLSLKEAELLLTSPLRWSEFGKLQKELAAAVIVVKNS